METRLLLEEGDIIILGKGHKVYAKVPEHFLYTNKKGHFNLARGEVTIEGEFEYLTGKYVVYKTATEGGGTGHGPHDVYPDGHHVYCMKVDRPDIEVDFYQTGCFTAMIKDIEPIGKAKLEWKMQE